MLFNKTSFVMAAVELFGQCVCRACDTHFSVTKLLFCFLHRTDDEESSPLSSWLCQGFEAKAIHGKSMLTFLNKRLFTSR